MNISNKKFIFLLVSLLLSCHACMMHEEDSDERFAEILSARSMESGASRADPGYMQYLDKQSLISTSARMAQMVSGSNLVWRHPSAQPQPDKLRTGHSVWLALNPQILQIPARSSALEHLSSPIIWQSLAKSGFKGIYIAPTGANGSLWDNDKKRPLGMSDDIIQYSFAKNIGSEQEYAALINRSKSYDIMLGGEMLPAATGIGPDFFLAIRNMREYPGLYCMIEVPQTLWNLLPQQENKDNELHAYPLTEEEIDALSQAHLFPRRMMQDYISRLNSGWAATNEVRGVDGNMRRWVYRYAYNHKRPILNFNDPSNTARQVMSGSAIFQAAILNNKLISYQLSPLIGLEPEAPDFTPASVGEAEFSLLTDISTELSRQIRTYGGYAVMTDPLPIPTMLKVMENGPDLTLDNILSPAAEHALLSGNASLLNFMTDEGLACSLDWKRLLHASSAHHGIDYSLPHLTYIAKQARSVTESAHENTEEVTSQGKSLQEENMQARAELARKLLADSRREAMQYATQTGDDQTSFKDNVLYTSPAGLAVLALNLGSKENLNEQETSMVQRGHLLLQFFKAMQPGFFMPAAQDLVGVLPVYFSDSTTLDHKKNAHLSSARLTGMRLPDERLADRRLAPMGSFPLISSANIGIPGGLGVPKSKNLYGTIDIQTHNPASFLGQLTEIISLVSNWK